MEKKARRISDGKEVKFKANRGASRLQITRASREVPVEGLLENCLENEGLTLALVVYLLQVFLFFLAFFILFTFKSFCMNNSH